MRLRTLISLAAVAALTGCPGGNGAIGDQCTRHGDCSSELQCLTNTCEPRCIRATECGDGYSCSESGLCIPATGQPGDACTSETECVAGLSCQIESSATAASETVVASCVAESSGRPAGETCSQDGDCRNGTCELGHCIDLCATTRDCGPGTSCTQIPRVAAGGHLFSGCLQDSGALTWSIPIAGPSSDVVLPIPQGARSVSVLFSVEDQNQKVGATDLVAPNGVVMLAPTLQFDYYTNPFVRHRPDFGQSVLTMPSAPQELQAGLYHVGVRSLRPRVDPMDPMKTIDTLGTATPSMTAVIKMGSSRTLDLHFYFLNLDEHPCAATFGGKLDAATAESAPFFKEQFLAELSSIFAPAVSINSSVTYEDLRDHPDLDGLDIENASSLLALGKHPTGINVFFVRTLSPVGLQAIGPNPGPAGLAGTRMSGVVVGLDTLCYRSWKQLARLTAHEIARYMGLYRNVEQDPLQPVLHTDPISDSDMSSTNLMFYSELGGADLSAGQADILSRSAVLH
jgi:hypothetical protein